MDPNAALKEIRAIVNQAGKGRDFDADRLAELFSGLDSWICGGGFLPSDWARWHGALEHT